MAKLSGTHGHTEQKPAAIAQSVERILGKDEVASSNLASSSKELRSYDFGVLFLSVAELATSSHARRADQTRGRKAPMQPAALDRVASSNLASSSKELRSYDFGVLFCL